jgi:hypothetical protein
VFFKILFPRVFAFCILILIFNFNSKFYFINFLIYEFEIKKSLKNSEKMENYWPTILATKKHDHPCINGKLVCRLDSKSYFIGRGLKI